MCWLCIIFLLMMNIIIFLGVGGVLLHQHFEHYKYVFLLKLVPYQEYLNRPILLLIKSKTLRNWDLWTYFFKIYRARDKHRNICGIEGFMWKVSSTVLNNMQNNVLLYIITNSELYVFCSFLRIWGDESICYLHAFCNVWLVHAVISHSIYPYWLFAHMMNSEEIKVQTSQLSEPADSGARMFEEQPQLEESFTIHLGDWPLTCCFSFMLLYCFSTVSKHSGGVMGDNVTHLGVYIFKYVEMIILQWMIAFNMLLFVY